MPIFITLPDLLIKLKKIRLKHSVVLVTGCFDILHSEHIKFLQAAKKRGDVLLVGLECDRRVRELKGLGRPVNRFNKRAQGLIKTKIADYVFPLPTKFTSSLAHQTLIAKIRPNILAVSSNTPNLDKKKEIVARFGGELRVVLPHNPAISTSRIIDSSQSAT